jgi:hypothetical protein
MSKSDTLQKENSQVHTEVIRANDKYSSDFGAKSGHIIRNLLSKSLQTATVDASGWKNVEESGGLTRQNSFRF